MPFDLIRFFDQHRIEYSEHGSNVSKDHVVIHCPFCGSADPGKHLSVSTKGKGYRCFRNPSIHKGVSPAKLIAAVLSISPFEAARMVGSDYYVPEGDFASRIGTLVRPQRARRDELSKLELLPEFMPFSNKPSCIPFVNHLVHKRGIAADDAVAFAQRFDLRYCTKGPFNNRIIFPIRYKRKLVNWTGRHIGNSNLRYRTLSTEVDVEERLPSAINAITENVIWFDECLRATKQASPATTILICEGPMDALKIWYLGSQHGVVATCLFTQSASVSQIDLLHKLLPRFKRRILLLDKGTMPFAMRINSQLSGLNVETANLKRYKDPCEIPLWKHLKEIIF